MSILLNDTLASAAFLEGLHLVNVIPDFAGHEVCSANPWINGIEYPRAHTLHPNEIGQRMYARALNDFLDETGINYSQGFFESGMPKNP